MHAVSDVSDYHEPDWAKLVRDYGRDRIPFLDVFVDTACRPLELDGRSVFVFDSRLGCTSLHVARKGCEVTCCVAGVEDGAELTRLLSENEVRNVSVVVEVPVSQGGPRIFPFLGRRFDVAVIAVPGAPSASTESALRETARLLKPGGSLVLIVWSHVMQSRPVDPTLQLGVERLSLSARQTWVPPFAAAVTRAGFENVVSSVLKVSCEAPSHRDFTKLSGSVKPWKRRLLGSAVMDAMDVMDGPQDVRGPVPMHGFAILLRAEAPQGS